MGDIYKVWCKSEGERGPIGADAIVRGAESEDGATKLVRDYFNGQPHLGIRIDAETPMGISEMTDEERRYHSNPALQAIGARVTVIALQEDNPPPGPEFYAELKRNPDALWKWIRSYGAEPGAVDASQVQQTENQL